MEKYFRKVLPALAAAAFLSLPFTAQAGHSDDPSTNNVHDLGHDVAPASLLTGPPSVHTDIAFWGDLAIQGNWTGFRILDVSAPGLPVLLKFVECNGNQGDVVVWDNIVVRSWN